MRKRFAAADRPEFRRWALGMAQKLGVQVGEPTSDMALVCQKAKDFDPNDNVLWELEANKSAPRKDVTCTECGEELAMSHGLYEKYMAMDKKPKVYCLECLAKVTEK